VLSCFTPFSFNKKDSIMSELTANKDEINVALQDLFCELKQIGKDLITELEEIEPNLRNAIDEIGAQYPDLPIEDALFKHFSAEFKPDCN
jgi:hypothetical protein